MMKRIVGYLPFSYQLLFSGYLPQYISATGFAALISAHSLDELRTLGRITLRAKQADRSETFSADIRSGIPPLDR